MDRRDACILVCAAAGSVNAARGMIGRVIRSTLKIRQWGVGPYHVAYLGVSTCHGDTPRYVLQVTDAEMDALADALADAAEMEGWSGVPADCYHD